MSVTLIKLYGQPDQNAGPDIVINIAPLLKLKNIFNIIIRANNQFLITNYFQYKQIDTVTIRSSLLLLLLSCTFSGCGNGTGTGAGQTRDTAAAGSPSSDGQPTVIHYAYVGKETCGGCHAEEMKLYRNSHHDQAMQFAGKETILGNFNNASFTYHDITSTFFQRNGKYFITTDGPDGRLEDFEIKYTFGVTPLQQYLVELPGGRLQALSIAWDSRRKKDGGPHWFHLYPDEKIDYQDALHWTGINQNWNYMCAECHTTGFKKNYDPDGNSYHSSRAEIDVSCEACHGPGSRHVELATDLSHEELNKIRGKGLAVNFGEALKGKWVFSGKSPIASLDAPGNNSVLIETCARCHSRRTTIDAGETFNKPLNDAHVISLLEPGLYYPDGQVNGEVYVYGSFIQSKMYAAGVDCIDCHEPHSAQLRLNGNNLCIQCHKAEIYDTTEHHFHKTGTRAAECTACHMPEKKFMRIDTRYDHSFRVPRPDLSIKLGTPNTCNQCHTDQSPMWAADTVLKWYGHDAFKFSFGEALAAAWQGDADAEDLLERVVKDSSVPAIARATAMENLGAYLNPDNIKFVLDGLKSGNALLRSASLNALSGLGINDRFRYMHDLLVDPVKSVRINAARLLAPLQLQDLPQQQKRLQDQAMQEYIDAQMQSSDRAYANVNLGDLYVDTREYEKALIFYKKAMALEAGYIPAYVNMADLYRLQDRDEESETILRHGLDINPRAAALHHALGLTLVRENKYDAALTYLSDAAKLAPDNIRFIVVYAVALNSLGETAKAIDVLTAAFKKHPRNRDLMIYLVTLHRDDGEPDKALGYAERLVRLTSGKDRQAMELLESVKEKIGVQ